MACLVTIAAIVLLALIPPAMAEDGAAASPADPLAEALRLYTSARQVSVPFMTDELPPAADGHEHAAVVLYVSGNRGQSWTRAQKRALPSTALEFRAANEGQYWCIFRGEPLAERGPSPAAGDKPDVIVTVDTTEPVLRQLVVLPSKAGQPLDVIWQVEDRSPLAQVEARLVEADAGEEAADLWPAPQVTLENVGRVRFAEAIAGKWVLHISFQDAAGNLLREARDVTIAAAAAVDKDTPSGAAPVEARIITPLDTQGLEQPEPSQAGEPDAAAPGSSEVDGNGDDEQPAEVPAIIPAGTGNQELEAPAAEVMAREQVAVLPTRTLRIDYEFDKSAPPEQVGLWVTRDGGGHWRLDQIDDRLSGAFIFAASDDGHYGFQIHRQRGQLVLGRPEPGQAPQREVIIDTQKPIVRWTAPLGPGAAEGPIAAAPAKSAPPVELRWEIDEANLLRDSLRLEVRPFGQIQWQLVAADVRDEGRFTWDPAADLRGRVELRLSARDRAGQEGSSRLMIDILSPSLPALPTATGRLQVEQAEAAALDDARRAYDLARVARLQERWEEAEKQLLRAVSLNPDAGHAWSDLGGIYLRDGKVGQAVDAYTRAAELLPESPNALYGLARSQAARKDYEPALKTLAALLAREPGDADAWLLNGDTLWQSGQYEQARQSWLKAMQFGGGSRGNLAAIQKRLELQAPAGQ